MTVVLTVPSCFPTQKEAIQLIESSGQVFSITIEVRWFKMSSQECKLLHILGPDHVEYTIERPLTDITKIGDWVKITPRK